MDWVHGLLFYVVLLISLVVHEAAHALTALWGGDKTAYLGGQVTLNPIPHINREPFGTVIIPVGILLLSGGQFCMGYAYTPIDPEWARRFPVKAALMSAAGPISNFLLALVAMIVIKVLVMTGQVAIHEVQGIGAFWRVFLPADGSEEGVLFAVCQFSTAFILLNMLLGILNLIPFPPLDGAGVLGGFFPRSMGKLYDFLRTQPLLMLVGFVGIFYGIQRVVVPAFNAAVYLIKLGE